MNSPFLIFTAIVFLVALGLYAYNYVTRDRVEPGSFQDWVRNPDYKAAAADLFRQRDEVEVPQNISPEEPKRMVDKLFKKPIDYINTRKLELIGQRAEPLLIAALNDSKTWDVRFQVDGFIDDSPCSRIIELLRPIGSESCIEPITRYLEHPHDHYRKEAAIALGHLGFFECVEPMRKAMLDEEEYVRSRVLMGIEHGLSDGRCTPEFLQAVYPIVLTALDDDSFNVRDKVPTVLLLIDKENAVKTLLSEQYLSTEYESLQDVLKALNEQQVQVPLEKLRPLLDEIRSQELKYPHTYQLAECLIAYAHNPDENCEAVLHAELESPEERVREGAAKGLEILANVADPYSLVCDLIEEQRFAGLTPPQQQYFAVSIYMHEVNNGGHSQYFVNGSGAYWKQALAGLESMMATERIEILNSAISLFGEEGPSTDGDNMHRQPSRFTKQQHESLDKLDNRFYACEEDLDVMLSLYAIHHKEHFAQPPSKSAHLATE